jgi:hypothetical protein
MGRGESTETALLDGFTERFPDLEAKSYLQLPEEGAPFTISLKSIYSDLLDSYRAWGDSDRRDLAKKAYRLWRKGVREIEVSISEIDWSGQDARPYVGKGDSLIAKPDDQVVILAPQIEGPQGYGIFVEAACLGLPEAEVELAEGAFLKEIPYSKPLALGQRVEVPLPTLLRAVSGWIREGSSDGPTDRKIQSQLRALKKEGVKTLTAKTVKNQIQYQRISEEGDILVPSTSWVSVIIEAVNGGEEFGCHLDDLGIKPVALALTATLAN